MTEIHVDGWQVVRFTADCDPGGEGWCDCIGPTEENVDYKVVDGVLYGRRLDDPDNDDYENAGDAPSEAA